MEIRKDRVHPDHTEHAGTEDHNHRRNTTLSDSSRCRNRTIHKRRDHIGKPHDPNTFQPCLNDRFIRSKQAEELPSEGQKQDTEGGTRTIA